MKKPERSSSEFFVSIMRNIQRHWSCIRFIAWFQIQMQPLMVISGLSMRVERIIFILPAIFPPSKCRKRLKNPCFEPPDSEPEKREDRDKDSPTVVLDPVVPTATVI
jgi:hypothetical protein